jgi:hypothetical protein
VDASAMGTSGVREPAEIRYIEVTQTVVAAGFAC